MPNVRGFVRSIYVDDDGGAWSLAVDADSAADPIRGWVPVDDLPLAPLPRAWMPRRVVGVDDTGRSQATRVGTLDADLWTGTADAWVFEGSDQMPHVATVIARQQERRAP